MEAVRLESRTTPCYANPVALNFSFGFPPTEKNPIYGRVANRKVCLRYRSQKLSDKFDTDGLQHGRTWTVGHDDASHVRVRHPHFLFGSGPLRNHTPQPLNPRGCGSFILNHVIARHKMSCWIVVRQVCIGYDVSPFKLLIATKFPLSACCEMSAGYP